MLWIRDGVTREVVLVAGYALKFPKFTLGWRMFLNGLLANMQEAEFGRAKWPELCPVLFSVWGGFLVVMPRARPLTDSEWEAFDPVRFCNRPAYLLPVEGKRCSFGILADQIVAVDYGN